MPISNFPNGFNNGVTIRGMPINIAYPGKVFFLNNSGVLAPQGIGASDGNKGTYTQPFLTLSGALLQCTAGRGDIIMVMPGHAEAISNATMMNVNKAGVAIVSMGVGNLRATFTLNTANTATINITADNVAFNNCLFIANFAAIGALFTLTTAKNFTLSDCEFRDTSPILNLARIVSISTVDNAADGLTVERCNWFGRGATANSCLVRAQANIDRVTIKDNYIAHAATTDAGLMPISTGKLVTNLVCEWNTINLVGASSATTGILITTNGTTNSGMISRNLIQSLDATTELLVTANSGFRYSQNYYSGTADTSGYLLPAADA